ncbi:hypothetical protein H2203_008011 [Taxawa tesnikishii (nom. ined.)]|nr:hypothetical protein H2203_008011 [Dothideales sp. JES 119]
MDADILSLSHWNVNAKTVESYRALQGRLFFVGDAAHRVPPWGALGLNSGIQDADNLIWKLALALKHPHKSYDRLLDTYDAERRPIGERVARTSLHNLQSHAGVMDAALGIAPTNSIEANTKAMAQYFDVTDKTGGARRRQAIAQALEIMDIEFDAHGAEVGWFYPSADLNNEGTATRHDGQLTKDGELDLCVYHPSTIPGHQLPHAWLERDSRRVSTRDLVHLAKLTLFAQSAQPWADLAHDLVHVEIIDPKIGWKDVDGAWRAQCGVGASGAIFVRPDGIVAYRVPDSASAAKANTSLNDVFAELVAILLKEAVPLSGERSVARYKL